MVQRLQDELVAWHTLRHDNIAPLFGVVQSCDTIAMISPWCDNGTLIHYLKEHNPSADRLSIVCLWFSGNVQSYNHSITYSSSKSVLEFHICMIVSLS